MNANLAERANPAERVVACLGGRGEVAERFKVSREAVRLWLINGIPPERALEVEEATRGTGFAVTAMEVLQFARERRADAANESQQMPLPLARG